MAYWCDDQPLNIEQRRLDAEQQRALARALEKGEPWAQRIADDLRRAKQFRGLSRDDT